MSDQVRERRGWYVYDWANSAFASTVLTLFLGPYITSVAKAAAGTDGFVYPLERQARETRVICRIHARRITLDAIHA